MNNIKYKSIDDYINNCTDEEILILTKLRNTIKSVNPNIQEIISYNMPAFKLKNILVFFAIYKNHIGFYPMPNTINVFSKYLIKYKTSKGAIQFPIDKPLPFNLIKKMVIFRIKEENDKIKNNENNIFNGLSAPAKRALEKEGIKSIKQLSKLSESELLSLHGIGKTSLPKIKKIISSN